MATEPECSTETSIVGTATSPLLSKFKVPQMLRRHNPEAYEPDVISIGPFHRGGGEKFKRMEDVKQLYLDTLLTRMKISLEEFIRRIDNEYIDNETEKGIDAFEKRARDFYADPLHDFPRFEFINMMIRDAFFIIQLVRKDTDKEKKDDDDPIWNMDSMFQNVCHDLLLLENQLPWFVLNYLYHLTLDSNPADAPKFSVVLLKAFRSLELFWHMCDSYIEHLSRNKDDDVLHILDLIRTSIVFSFKPFEPSRECLWCFAGKEEEEEEIGLDIHPATALSEAGVIFEKGSAKNLMAIKFEKGDLTIPQLTVGELTEPLFRNLIAFEQCYDLPKIITSYAVFMGRLISSKSDMELLSRKKIIRNWLSVEDGFKFFNNLSADTTVQTFEYKQLCAEVDKYSQVGWNKYVTQLRRKYFASPWTIISLIAGIILLVLMLLQTIFIILSSPVFTGIRVHELSADM